MGQKAIPTGLRLGINRTWNSRWFAEGKEYVDFFLEDLKLKNFLEKQLSFAGVEKILIERPKKTPCITIYSAKPGLIIGKKGAGIEEVKKKLVRLVGGTVSLGIVEIRKPDTYAKILSDSVAQQLERRVSYKRASKRAMQAAMKSGAKGVKIVCAGRLGGAEIARKEWFRQGRVPAHTLRADVDYGESIAKTSYGVCGIKVFVYRGDAADVSSTAQERVVSADY